MVCMLCAFYTGVINICGFSGIMNYDGLFGEYVCLAIPVYCVSLYPSAVTAQTIAIEYRKRYIYFEQIVLFCTNLQIAIYFDKS